MLACALRFLLHSWVYLQLHAAACTGCGAVILTARHWVGPLLMWWGRMGTWGG